LTLSSENLGLAFVVRVTLAEGVTCFLAIPVEWVLRGRTKLTAFLELKTTIHQFADGFSLHTFWLPPREQRRHNAPRVKDWATAIVILPLLLATFVLAEDFKTVSGKVYKDATVSRVEADGIELKTKSGIAKVYFSELPEDVQERFHWSKPAILREPFFGRWAEAAEDPAVLAKIIAAATVIIAGVALVNGYVRSRRQPPTRIRRASRRKPVHRAPS
jgi:hypothetical protein